MKIVFLYAIAYRGRLDFVENKYVSDFLLAGYRLNLVINQYSILCF